MSRHTKVIAALLTAVFLFSTIGAISAYAEADVNQDPDPVVTEQPYNPEPEPTYPDMPVDPDPVVTEQPYNPEPYNPDPYIDDGGNSGGGSGSGSGGSSSGSNTGNNGNNGSGWVDGDGNVFSSPEEVYVGGGQSYQPPQSTAPSAALYETKNKKIDDNTLSSNDWGDIASKLKNAGNTVADDDGSGDFTFIQQNTAKEDNGHWIIIVGAACLLLSLIGFIYLIASAISRRRKLKGAMAAGGSQGGYYRANDDYDDGYKPAAKKEKTPRNGRRYK